MKFWRYRLPFGRAPNLRTGPGDIEGALVLYQGGLGCLQPWPSLGDGSLVDHVTALLDGEPTDIGAACLRCCEIDAKARREGRSLFEGLQIPASHVLLETGDEGELGRARVAGIAKLKGEGLALPEDVGFALRVDFNGALDADGFRRWAHDLSERRRNQIDFVEDPVPYDADLWEALVSETGLRLALDRGPADATRGFAVRVWKPARLADAPAGELFCITHNMDHEIGRRYAAYRAATFTGKLTACGLGELGGFDGIGLGCDSLLAELPWEER